jgi:hypothetical protein
MSAANDKPPFDLQVGYDQDELLGARWWQDGLRAASAGRASPRGGTDDTRRSALKVLFALGGFAVVAGIAFRSFRRSPMTIAPPVDMRSLDLQRQNGLATGAEQESFAWPDEQATTRGGVPFDRSGLERLATELRPDREADLPDYVPTLFQCFAAPGGAEFTRQFRPVHSAAMAKTFLRGDAIRELFAVAERRQQWAVIVDLPGPESVAFAAALAPLARPVFTFDNWPHPRGVVPAHLTLAAAVWYRERFTAPPTSEPRALVYVLDRNRLAPYANEPNRFDNRYVAKLPPAASLVARDVQRVLYVVPEGVPVDELEDLSARFVEYENAGLGVRMLGLQDLTLADASAAKSPGTAANTATGSSPRYYWHGTPGYHWWFWNHYGWASRPAGVAAERPPVASFGSNWSPARRTPSVANLSRFGRTSQPRSEPNRSTSGGSWPRSSGGFGG